MNIELANGLRTSQASITRRYGQDSARRTSHERYNGYVQELATPSPILGIFIILFLEIEKLDSTIVSV